MGVWEQGNGLLMGLDVGNSAMAKRNLNIQKKKAKVLESCPTLQPCGLCLPGSSVHGILQGWILKWVATSYSRRSSWPRDQTHVSCIAGRFFPIWTTNIQAKIHSVIQPAIFLSQAGIN